MYTLYILYNLISNENQKGTIQVLSCMIRIFYLHENASPFLLAREVFNFAR